MTKQQLLAFATKLSVSFKAMFPLKSQVTDDINAAKASANSYTDTQINGVNDTISTFQANLDGKIDARVAALGTFVGKASTYAGLPTQDHLGNAIGAGDVAYLDTVDGDHKIGYYRYDGNAYVYMSGDLQSTDILNMLKATSLDTTVDDKFVTPKWVKDYDDSQQPTQAEVDNATA